MDERRALRTPQRMPSGLDAGSSGRAARSRKIYLSSACYSFSEAARMAEEKKGKAEETAEKTGELVGKGLKKGFGIAKAFGKGTKDALEKKKE